ncbi:MAG TPA: hypothetical protein DIW41_00465, partial [Lachnospiraceae bacterium]|nr:hypothetical protein [Lachnospiraceae bacterium]
MKKRRRKVFAAIIGIVIIAVIATVFFSRNNTEYIAKTDEKEVQAAYNLLQGSLKNRPVTYADFLAAGRAQAGHGTY